MHIIIQPQIQHNLFSQKNITYFIIENSKPGTYVGQLKLNYYEITLNRYMIRYYILKESEVCSEKNIHISFPFTLNSSTGIIQLSNSELDREKCAIYYVKVVAELFELTNLYNFNNTNNNNSIQLLEILTLKNKIKSCFELDLFIVIEDENDNLPILKIKSEYLMPKSYKTFNNSYIYELSIPEIIEINSILIHFLANDADYSG